MIAVSPQPASLFRMINAIKVDLPPEVKQLKKLQNIYL